MVIDASAEPGSWISGLLGLVLPDSVDVLVAVAKALPLKLRPTAEQVGVSPVLSVARASIVSKSFAAHDHPVVIRRVANACAHVRLRIRL
jgi:hypothetical protein